MDGLRACWRSSGGATRPHTPHDAVVVVAEPSTDESPPPLHHLAPLDHDTRWTRRSAPVRPLRLHPMPSRPRALLSPPPSPSPPPSTAQPPRLAPFHATLPPRRPLAPPYSSRLPTLASPILPDPPPARSHDCRSPARSTSTTRTSSSTSASSTSASRPSPSASTTTSRSRCASSLSHSVAHGARPADPRFRLARSPPRRSSRRTTSRCSSTPSRPSPCRARARPR